MAEPDTTESDARDAELRRAGWRLMFASVRTQRAWVVSGVLMGLVWTAARVVIPLLAAVAIDDGIVAGDTSVTFRYAAIIIVIGVVQALASGGRRYSAFRLALRVETDLRDRLFAHLQRLHFAFHDQAQTGQLMARANTDLQQINTILILVPLASASVLTMIAVAVVLFANNGGLAVLMLLPFPFLNVAATRFSKKMQPVGLELQEELADLSSVVEESVSGVRAVKGFGAEALQERRLEHEAEAVYDRSVDAAWLRSRFLPLIDLLPTLAMVAILWYGGHQVLDGNLQVGDLVAFNSYVVMMVWPLRMLGMIIAQASRASASAGRVHEVLVTDPAVADPAQPVALPVDGGGAVSFRDVRFGYLGSRPVLNGFTLDVTAGEAVAIVGATGSGKTTVARLIPRFYDVDAGSVTIDGVDVRAINVRRLRRSIGIVFEDTFLFSDTVRENIAFADPDADDATVRAAARLAGASTFIEALPDGYRTVIGEQGFSLSGGQRQRIAIARAVLASPRVLILDDATSSVDPTKEHEIRAALQEVMRGRTTIIIAHRPATIALADRVVLVQDGKVVASGTHADLLATDERYRAVLAQTAAAGHRSGPGLATDVGAPS